VDLASPHQVQYPPEIKTVVMTATAQNQGIESLEEAIAATVQQGNLQAANLDFAINQRQAEALTRANGSLGHTLRSIEEGLPLDFWSIDLRGAVQALGEITGEEVTESVLVLYWEVIFNYWTTFTENTSGGKNGDVRRKYDSTESSSKGKKRGSN
jgi:tRNA modification GTPase